MSETKRLIESAFPLQQASLDSLHEKNVRHGHLSTLHIWPARRPLAASRAALIATLLPDPGDSQARKQLMTKLGGTVVEVPKKKKLPGGQLEERLVEETAGGVLHWGRESGPGLAWFKGEIRRIFGNHPPTVLDPFAGGGAIPLEAMRLGCEATAIDINPVAWFVLKCTLEYPQRLAGHHRPLPNAALDSPEFMEAFFKGTGALTKKQLERNLQAVQAHLFPAPDVDLAWQIRAWGWWVLKRATAALEPFYPSSDGRPPVAYLWARTVECKNCRARVPLLKTRWLCRNASRRILLTVTPTIGEADVSFGIEADVPVAGHNAAQRREHDRRIGAGTMTRSGVRCPCCAAIMAMEDLRLEGRAGRLGTQLTAVVVEGTRSKEYRPPTEADLDAARGADAAVAETFAEIPFGAPNEPTPGAAGPKRKSSSLRIYGFLEWKDVYMPRQLVAIGTFIRYTRAAREAMREAGYPSDWIEAVAGYLALAIDRLADRGSTLCSWTVGYDKIRNTFTRFALPITWDFAESVPYSDSSGGYPGAIEWIAEYVEHATLLAADAPPPTVKCASATQPAPGSYDVVLTDPPYYDSIIYADIMDFFYIWLRRTLFGLSPEIDDVFRAPLAPKWDHERNDGELVDEPGRFDWDAVASRHAYEDGMFRAFQACNTALKADGRLVIVFAHKDPTAWETLVSATIRANFVVDGSWPIQTEMGNRTRALASAALSSSVWLVCRKRPATVRPGWDNLVLEEMRDNIRIRLREFWDAGIRGPDFVWAATGPALEAYSKYPAVRKADEPGQLLGVSEFLGHVRRMVVDFVVGRVLAPNGDVQAIGGLDDVTTYYLLHRQDFKLEDAPTGPCILYAVSCGLSLSDLMDRFDLLAPSGRPSASPASDELSDPDLDADDSGVEPDESGGNMVRLKAWNQRPRILASLEHARSDRAARAVASVPMFPEAAAAPLPIRESPLIDQVHQLMHLWKAADAIGVDEYLDVRGLRRSTLFHHVLQALIELAPANSEERGLLESLSNHIEARSPAGGSFQPHLDGAPAANPAEE